VMPRELTLEDFSDIIHMIAPDETPLLRGWDYYRLEAGSAGHMHADSVASTASKRT
jgi:hypothetical protein